MNNAYQYIINREETHVSWLQHALLDLRCSHARATRPRTALAAPGKGDAWKSLAAEDGRANTAFVETLAPEGRGRDPRPATRAC